MVILFINIILPSWSLSSIEAKLVLVSTKNHDLWEGPILEVWDSQTSCHSAHAQRNLIGQEYKTNSVRMLGKLDLPRGHDSWCWSKGVQPVGTRMHYDSHSAPVKDLVLSTQKLSVVVMHGKRLIHPTHLHYDWFTYVQDWTQVLFTYCFMYGRVILTFSYYFIFDRIMCVLVTFLPMRTLWRLS